MREFLSKQTGLAKLMWMTAPERTVIVFSSGGKILFLYCAQGEGVTIRPFISDELNHWDYTPEGHFGYTSPDRQNAATQQRGRIRIPRT